MNMRIKLLIAFATTLLLVGCGESAPVKTTLSALSQVQKDFDGRLVMVSGTLRTFNKPRHYWIESDALDRVAPCYNSFPPSDILKRSVI